MKKVLCKGIAVFAVHVKKGDGAHPVWRQSACNFGIIGVVYQIVARLASQKVIVRVSGKFCRNRLSRRHVGQKRPRVCVIISIGFGGGRDNVVLAGMDRNPFPGQRIKTGFGQNLYTFRQIDMFFVKAPSILLAHNCIHPENQVRGLSEILDGKPVPARQCFDFLLLQSRLVHTVMIAVIKWTRMDIEHLPHTHHRDIKDGKCAARNQHGADKEIVDGLFSLKFHHASGNDIFVRMLSFSHPAMYNRVQHDHVEPHKDRCIEHIDQRCRVGAKQLHIDSRRLIAADRPGKNEKNPHRAAPSAKLFDRLVLVLLVHDINNVGPPQITVCRHAGEGDHKHKKHC